MVIAEVRLPTRLVIPKSVRTAARADVIDTHHRTEPPVPFGASVWITCRHAWPHVDPSFEGRIFLTLSVLSAHEAGDSQASQPMTIVPRGYLFVVDPMVPHWIGDRACGSGGRSRPWAGLQWDVDRDNAKETARRIVSEKGGRWLHTDDSRYEGWAPTALMVPLPDLQQTHHVSSLCAGVL